MFMTVQPSSIRFLLQCAVRKRERGATDDRYQINDRRVTSIVGSSSCDPQPYIHFRPWTLKARTIGERRDACPIAAGKRRSPRCLSDRGRQIDALGGIGDVKAAGARCAVRPVSG